MGMKYKETSISFSEKAAFLKGTIRDLNEALKIAKEELKESDTYKKKKISNGIIWGSTATFLVGIGSMMSLSLLEPSLGAAIGSVMPMVLGSAGMLLGVVTLPFVQEKDKIEKNNLEIIEDAQEELKSAKKALKAIKKNR